MEVRSIARHVSPLLVIAALAAVTGCGRDARVGGNAGGEVAAGSWSEQRDSLAVESVQDDKSVCTDCLSVAKVAELGSDARPDGYALPTFAMVRDARGNYWLNQGQTLKVFDSAGTFVREVGRAGSGPMEWSYPVPVGVDAPGNMHIVDKGNQRETIVGPDFTRVSDRAMPSMDIQHIVPLGDDYAVSAWGTAADEIAQPLHVIRAGVVFKSFGAPRSGEPVTPYTARRVITADAKGHLFSVSDYDYEIEAWTSDGRRMIGMSGPTLNQQPVKQGLYNRNDNPVPNQIQSMQADDAGRLWVLSWHVRPTWRDLLVDHRYANGRTGLVPKPGVTADSIYFSRIDVIDLDTHTIVARFDRAGLLMGWAGRGLVWENRSDDQHPGVWIWRVARTDSAHRTVGATSSPANPLP